MSIKCSSEDDIFTTKEKTGSITLDIPFNAEQADYEYDNDVRIQLEGKSETLIIERTDTENMHVSMTARFFHYKSDIIIFDDGRKHLCSLSFQTDEIAEKVMKIVWKYKLKLVDADDIFFSFEDPPYSITQSCHDLAAVFSYEEKTGPIKLLTSYGILPEVNCSISIDMENEVLNITLAGDGDSDLPGGVITCYNWGISEILGQKDASVFFEFGAEKRKLIFDDVKTAEKVAKIVKQFKETNKVLETEETALTLALEKLEEDPQSIENVKELIKYYAKVFTIYKEEHQNRIYELYQKYDFHEKIVAANEKDDQGSGDVEVRAVNNGTPNSRKRKAQSFNEVPAKKIKRDDSEIIYYPDFEFQCDKDGIPKKELIVFASKTKCYKFFPDGNGYKCSGCTGDAVKAKYYVNEYGETFIKTKGKHDCRPVLHKPENIPDSETPLFEFFFEHQNRNSTSARKLRIFTPSKNGTYEYLHLEDSETELWYCTKCKVQGKYVYAHVEKGDDGEQIVKLLDEDHVCTPDGYKLPEKSVKAEKEDFVF